MQALEIIAPPVGIVGDTELLKGGKIERGDKGFKQLVDVLEEHGVSYTSEVKTIEMTRIDLTQDLNKLFPNISPITWTLVIEFDDGQKIQLGYNPFDPSKPTVKLKDWIEHSYLKRLIPWVISVIVMWLMINSYFLWLNK